MASSIGVMLATRIAEEQLTDAQVAERLGVTQSTVTRWRLGRVVPGEDHAAALATFLGIAQSKVRAMIDRQKVYDRHDGEPDGTLGHLLLRMESERGIDGGEAYRRSGLDKSRYYRFRANKGIPPLADLPALAKALDIPVNDLLLACYHTELYKAGNLRTAPRRR